MNHSHGGGRHSTWRVGLIALTFLVTACQAAPATSAAATASVASAPSATPTLMASPTATAAGSGPGVPSAVLPPDSLARLTVETPTYSFQGSDGIMAPTGPPVGMLQAGQEIAVVGGPRLVDGWTWYLVLPMPSNPGSVAWMRVDREDAVVPVPPTCPGSDQGALALRGWDRVTCFASRTLRIEARVDHCQGGVVLVDPGWLGYACWRSSDETGDIDLHAKPDSGITFPDEFVRARISGHFDDPAASTCTFQYAADTPSWIEPSIGEQVLLCREAFVVDRFEVLESIGTPPLS